MIAVRGGFQGRMMSDKKEDFRLSQLDRRALKVLFGYTKPYLLQLILATLTMFVVTATTLAGPYLTKIAVDDYIMTRDLTGLNWLVLVMIFTYGLFWVSSYWQTYLASWIGQRIVSDIRVDLFSHLQQLDMGFFHRNKTGDIMSRVTHDVNALADVVTTGFIHVLNDVFTLVGIAVIMISLSPQLALISLLTMPIIVFVMTYLGKKMRSAYRDVREKLAALNADVEEGIAGIRVVQALNREALNTGQFNKLSWENLKANLKAVSLFALLFPTMTFSRVLGEGLVLWYGGWGVVNGVVSLGVMMAFLGYVRRFFAPLADLSQVYNTYQSAGAAMDRIVEYLAVKPSIEEPKHPQLPQGNFTGAFGFNQVSFGYGEHEVVQDLNVSVDAGEVLAVVGPTGAGKTTIANLLSRLYDVDEGSITLDDIDIRDIPLALLRNEIAVVPQNVFLADTSIRENIRYGRLEASDEEVEMAARRVRAHSFITDLPNGYDTTVGEGGARLSGGQKQLVSFARALLANPKILILDEATSSVDAYTELLIQQALGELLTNRTALMIAHRFSTLKKANRIAVFSEGQLNAIGTHDELMQASELYRDLVKKQGIDVA